MVARRVFVVVIAVTALVRSGPSAQEHSGLANRPDSLKFAAIGDNGTGEQPEYDVANQMDRWHRRFPFDLVIMLGDNLYGSQKPADFELKFERPYKPLLDAGVKFYASLGNHDKTSNDVYKPFNMGGERYYTYTRNNVLGLVGISRHRLVADVHPAAGVLIVAAVAASLGLRRSGVRSIWPYLSLAGPLAWWGCYWAGVHPALALLPIVPLLPHTPRHFGDLAVHGGIHRTASHFESVFEYPVHVISFFFGLVNAGVLLHGFDSGTWAVLMASVAGRPLGILVGTTLAVTAGLTPPRQVGWKDLCVMALVASAGGAFSLFLASARVLRVGRFATDVQRVRAAVELRRHA